MIEIRRFSPADEQAVIDVILPIQQEEFGFDYGRGPAGPPAIPEFYQSGDGDFWLPRPAAASSARLPSRISEARRQHCARCSSLATFAAETTAWPTRLLKALLAHAERRKTAAIFLGTTEKFLAAHRFCEKNGFVQIACEDLPPNFPFMGLDTRFYVHRLTPAA